MRVVPSLLIASLLLAVATPAHAGGPPGTIGPEVPAPAPATTTRVERYGKQIVLADLAWLGALYLVGSAEARNSNGDGGMPLTSLLALGYFATGPIVHLRHGNKTGAAKSLAARALLPVGGMLVGGMLAAGSADDGNGDDIDDSFAVLGGMMLGFGAGIVSAVVLDWTVFSKKTVEARPATWAVTPRLSVNKHGVVAGVGGSF